MHKNRASITAQLSLIKKAERTGEPFDQVLESAGWSYDDLIYERSRTRAWAGPPPLRLEELRIGRPPYSGCELFRRLRRNRFGIGSGWLAACGGF